MITHPKNGSKNWLTQILFSFVLIAHTLNIIMKFTTKPSKDTHSKRTIALTPSILLATIVALFASRANAVQSINVQTFNPSVSDHFVLLEDAFKSEWPKTAKFYFGANYNYVSEPLVALDNTQTVRAFNIIERIQTLDLFFGFKPSPKFGLFFGAPIHFVGYPASPAIGYPGGSASVLGDFKILAKIRLTDDSSATSVALIPEIHLPTGNTENFVSDASTYLGARLAIEHTFDSWTFAGNLGFAAASNAVYQTSVLVQGIDYRKRFLFGLGGFMPFSDQWGMNIEFNSIHMLPFDKNLNPNELYAGLRLVANDSTIVTFGGSIGKIGGASGQNYRIIAGLRYTLYEEEKHAPVPLAAYTPAPVYAPIAKATPWPAPVMARAPKAIMRAKRIEILQPINFENDSARLAFDAKGVLDDVAAVMKKNKRSFKKIMIDGHTNSIGDQPYNLRLSKARSTAVKTYLIQRGIPASWMIGRGFGKSKPKVAVTDPNAIEINRRVEFIVIK
jgi:outer membrane protein OmpA-like peptidoglycan-associated protein